MKRLAVLVSVMTLAAGLAQAEDGTSGSTVPVATPSAEIDYQNINEAIQMGAGFGDMTAGAHGTFGKFPDNFITPVHTHTAAYHGIVLAGTMTNPFGKDGEDANPPQMGTGSYWYVPAGMPHATACVSDEPCQFYFHSAGAFDFEVHEE